MQKNKILKGLGIIRKKKMSEVNFDFTVLEDGRFPHEFGFAALKTANGGDKSMVGEPSPDIFYRVASGLALFQYTEDIQGSDTYQRGMYSSPGFFHSKDVLARASFGNPFQYWDNSLDSFEFHLGIGCRGKNQIQDWIGGLLYSSWRKTDGWNPRNEMSIVSSQNCVLTKIESSQDDFLYHDINEFAVKISGKQGYVGFNNVGSLVSEIDFQGESSLCLFFRLTTEVSGVFTSHGSLRKFYARDYSSGIKPISFEYPTQFIAPEICEPHFFAVPIQYLERLGLIRKIAAEMWEFLDDVTMSGGSNTGFSAKFGDVIVAHQNFLPAYPLQWCRFKYDLKK
jgi:hypothetical protein